MWEALNKILSIWPQIRYHPPGRDNMFYSFEKVPYPSHIEPLEVSTYERANGRGVYPTHERR